MPEFKLNGKTYSGSTSYASAIDYTEADGSKTTVQDKISEMDGELINNLVGKHVCHKKYISNTTMADYFSGIADGEVRIFGFSNVTGMPTLTNGTAIAIKTNLSGAVSVIAFHDDTIESARITPS